MTRAALSAPVIELAIRETQFPSCLIKGILNWFHLCTPHPVGIPCLYPNIYENSCRPITYDYPLIWFPAIAEVDICLHKYLLYFLFLVIPRSLFFLIFLLLFKRIKGKTLARVWDTLGLEGREERCAGGRWCSSVTCGADELCSTVTMLVWMIPWLFPLQGSSADGPLKDSQLVSHKFFQSLSIPRLLLAPQMPIHGFFGTG